MKVATQGTDIIVIPFHDYKAGQKVGFRDRDTHFIEFLIEHNDAVGNVLIIDRPTTLPELVVKRAMMHVTSGTQIASGIGWWLTKMGQSVFVLDVLDFAIVGPVRRRRAWWIDAYRSARLARLARLAIGRIGIQNAVAVLHHPFGINLLRHIPHRGLVFDAMDNFSKIPHFARTHKALTVIYKDIVEQAGVVLAVSPSLRASLFESHPDTRIVRNGVDIARFSVRDASCPVSLGRTDNEKTIGFVGTLSERVNADLLEAVARLRPTYHFVLFGPIVNRRMFARLMKLTNVSFNGDIHYALVPSLIHQFDICMLPMHVGTLENDGDSIKLYEYIAAGKPVVSTQVAMIDRLKPYVPVGSTAVEFAEIIDKIFAHGCNVTYPAHILNGLTWSDIGIEFLAAVHKVADSQCSRV